VTVGRLSVVNHTSQSLCSYNNFFLVLWCRFNFCRVGLSFVVGPQRMWDIFELQCSSIFMIGPEESMYRHTDGTCFGSVDIDIHRQPLTSKHRPVSSEITREATAMSWVASVRCLSFHRSLHSFLFHSFLLPSR